MTTKLIRILALLVVLAQMSLQYNVVLAQDLHTKEAKHLKKLEKAQINENYKRKLMDRKPSGFMTMDEYEKMSAPKDKASIDYGIPKIDKPYDMQYVPRPTYKLTKYNDPPGSPDLVISNELYKTRQLNLPGITSPNFYFMVYPAVYYYPESAAISCDLFIIALRDNDTSINKILKANIANRFPEPILSTDKELTNSSAYRTLTPIDFSADSTKLLVKEKIGSSADGIWQTNLIVYDFNKRTSYNLSEIREAISYYWKEYKGLDLNDKRWDIFPLGFSKGNPDRILVTAYAYTGNEPVFLGVWSIDTQGNQSRLISMQNGSIEVAANGYKIVKDGVMDKTLSKKQEKVEHKFVKQQAKIEKKEDRAEVKEIKAERKQELKDLNKQYKLEKEEYKLRNNLKGSTEVNDNTEKYEELLDELEEKRKIQAEKEEEKQKLKEQKAQEKLLKQQQKQQSQQSQTSPQPISQP